MTPKELLQSYKEEKIRKRREQKLNSYYKNHNIQPKELKDTKEANKKRAYRQRQADNRQKQADSRNKETIRKRRYRQSLKNHDVFSMPSKTEQNIDNSECFGVKFVKIYPEMTSQYFLNKYCFG